MADFSTIVTPSNTSLDLYCKSITQSSNAYVVYSQTLTGVNVAPGSPVILSFSSSSQQLVNNIIVDGSSTQFTLSKKGIYLIDMAAAMDLNATPLQTLNVELLINGTTNAYDVGYGTGIANYTYKATVKSYAIKVSDALPVVISFRSTAVTTTGTLRYAQLSIVKIA